MLQGRWLTLETLALATLTLASAVQLWWRAVLAQLARGRVLARLLQEHCLGFLRMLAWMVLSMHRMCLQAVSSATWAQGPRERRTGAPGFHTVSRSRTPTHVRGHTEPGGRAIKRN